ncbi:MAG: cytochrome P450 [Pseudomonadales bacterium]|nr:cytochrome P450 [Pseudomonadales bacterium]
MGSWIGDNKRVMQESIRPPMVSGLPLVGSLLPLLNNPHDFIQEAYHRYGPAFRFRAAHREYVVLAGVKANRFVSGEGKDLFGVDTFWGKAGEYMGCPHMMIAVDGDIHRYQRNAMMPLLSQTAFKNRIEDLAEPVELIIKEYRGVRSADIGAILRQLISNQIGFTLQGHMSSYRTVQQMIYYFGSVMNVYGLRKWPAAMLRTPRFQYAKYVTHQHVRKTLEIAEARTEDQKQDRPLYLDAMLPIMRAKPDWYCEGDIAVHALLPFVAALDTVASTMGFILYRLLTNPTLAEHIQKEVDLYFGNSLPSLKQLREMDDLNGLIKETMRIQPTGFGITRSAKTDFEFEGFKIRQGAEILVFTTADHRNPEYFHNPELFDIQRYRAPRNEHKQVAYAPFGKGPHSCLGASLSEIMMPLNLGLLLNKLVIKPASELSKVKLRFNPAPVLSDNFKVDLFPRK